MKQNKQNNQKTTMTKMDENMGNCIYNTTSVIYGVVNVNAYY